MKVLDIVWFSNMFGITGIARVETEYDGIKYYISPVIGADEKFDTERVADYGSTFPKAAGDALFGV